MNEYSHGAHRVPALGDVKCIAVAHFLVCLAPSRAQVEDLLLQICTLDDKNPHDPVVVQLQAAVVSQSKASQCLDELVVDACIAGRAGGAVSASAGCCAARGQLALRCCATSGGQRRRHARVPLVRPARWGDEQNRLRHDAVSIPFCVHAQRPRPATCDHTMGITPAKKQSLLLNARGNACGVPDTTKHDMELQSNGPARLNGNDGSIRKNVF